jgi:hypothetical protein
LRFVAVTTDSDGPSFLIDETGKRRAGLFDLGAGIHHPGTERSETYLYAADFTSQSKNHQEQYGYGDHQDHCRDKEESGHRGSPAFEFSVVGM